MVGVGPGAGADLTALPWVRVLRYEPQTSEWWRPRVRAFDVVHEDYLHTYFDWVSTLGETFASQVLQLTPVLLAGRGFAPALGHGTFPAPVQRHTRRSRLVQARLMIESAWATLTRRRPPFDTYLRDPLTVHEAAPRLRRRRKNAAR